jgi:hypothetical protein
MLKLQRSLADLPGNIVVKLPLFPQTLPVSPS